VGGLWSAAFAGHGILHYSGEGELLQKIHMPVSCPTALTFGGPELTRTFVTTSQHALPADHTENQAGALFTVDLGARGQPASVFWEGRRS
jgi:sugar lactone lactonase YvrE